MFKEQSLELIRLFYLLERDLAKSYIYDLYSNFVIVPKEINYLVTGYLNVYEGSYFDNNRELIPNEYNDVKIIEDLKDNPFYGQENIGKVVIGYYLKNMKSSKSLYHLKSLKNIIDEPNFRFCREDILKRIDQANSYNYVEIYEKESYTNLVDDLKKSYARCYCWGEEIEPTTKIYNLPYEKYYGPYQEYRAELIKIVMNNCSVELDISTTNKLCCFILEKSPDSLSYSCGQAHKYFYMGQDFSLESKPQIFTETDLNYLKGRIVNFFYHFDNSNYETIKKSVDVIISKVLLFENV